MATEINFPPPEAGKRHSDERDGNPDWDADTSSLDGVNDEDAQACGLSVAMSISSFRRVTLNEHAIYATCTDGLVTTEEKNGKMTGTCPRLASDAQSMTDNDGHFIA